MHLYIMKISYGVLQKEEGLCMKHHMRLFPMQTPIWNGIQRKRRDVLHKGIPGWPRPWYWVYVPFENLDVWCFKGHSARHWSNLWKGGDSCCEAATVLNWMPCLLPLLKDLGFRMPAPVCMTFRNKNYVPLVLHRGIIVELMAWSISATWATA